MTRNQKLDAVLNGLANLYIREKRGQRMPDGRTLAFLNSAMSLEMELWEMDSLEEQLVHDGYAQLKGSTLRLTEDGRKFLAEKHGYEGQAKETQLQEHIKREPLRAARRDRWKVWLMFAALIISLAAFVSKEQWREWLSALTGFVSN